MTTFIRAVMQKVPEGATQEQRTKMFFDFCQETQRLNPGTMLPLGVKKNPWRFWETEHPFTTKYADKLPKQ